MRRQTRLRYAMIISGRRRDRRFQIVVTQFDITNIRTVYVSGRELPSLESPSYWRTSRQRAGTGGYADGLDRADYPIYHDGTDPEGERLTTYAITLVTPIGRRAVDSIDRAILTFFTIEIVLVVLLQKLALPIAGGVELALPLMFAAYSSWAPSGAFVCPRRA